MLRFADFLKDQQIVKPQGVIRKPLVSVIMPTYCRAHDGLLARAIRSVLSQTLADFEFIIVDDGSTDASQDVIRDFQRQDDRILYVRHEVNSGLPALRADEAILLGRGDYVATQTDDDEWLGPFLQTVLGEAVTRNRPFVHCQTEWLLQGKVHRSRFPITQPSYLSLIQGNKIGHSSALVHRSVFQAIGLYDPHVILRRWTDWGFLLRVAREITPYMIPEVLVRVHGELPDSMGIQTPTVGYEDFMLMLQASRNADLVPARILDYDVASLDRYIGKLPQETVRSSYCSLVLPWLRQREEQLANLGISSDDVAKIKEEITASFTGKHGSMEPRPQEAPNRRTVSCNDIMSGKTRPSSAVAGVRQIVGRLLRPSTGLTRLAQTSYRFFCSVIVTCKTLLRDQDDALDTLPLDFQRIKDDPLMATYHKHGFVLGRSCDLRNVPFLPYKITVRGTGLRAISLALQAAGPTPRGAVIIDVASENNQVVVYAAIPMFSIDSGKPVEFFLEPPLKAGEYSIRFFGRNLNVPVYVLEFRKYRLIRRLFFGPVLNE